MYKPIGKIRAWCQRVLPLTYDSSLSYYELLSKIINTVNLLIKNQEALKDAIENIDIEPIVNQRFQELVDSGYFDDKLDAYLKDHMFDVVYEAPDTLVFMKGEPVE